MSSVSLFFAFYCKTMQKYESADEIYFMKLRINSYKIQLRIHLQKVKYINKIFLFYFIQ